MNFVDLNNQKEMYEPPFRVFNFQMGSDCHDAPEENPGFEYLIEKLGYKDWLPRHLLSVISLHPEEDQLRPLSSYKSHPDTWMIFLISENHFTWRNWLYRIISPLYHTTWGGAPYYALNIDAYDDRLIIQVYTTQREFRYSRASRRILLAPHACVAGLKKIEEVWP